MGSLHQTYSTMKLVLIVIILGFVVAPVGSFSEHRKPYSSFVRKTGSDFNSVGNGLNISQEGGAISHMDNGNKINCTSSRMRSLNLHNQCLAIRKLKYFKLDDRFATLLSFFSKNPFPLYESYFDPNIVNKPYLSQNDERKFINAWNRAALDTMRQGRMKDVEKMQGGLEKGNNFQGMEKMENGKYLTARSVSPAMMHKFGFSRIETYLDHVTNGMFSNGKSSFTIVDDRERHSQDQGTANAGQGGYSYGVTKDSPHNDGKAIPTDSIVDALIYQIQTAHGDQYQSLTEASDESEVQMEPSNKHKPSSHLDSAESKVTSSLSPRDTNRGSTKPHRRKFDSSPDGNDVPDDFWKLGEYKSAAKKPEAQVQEKPKALTVPDEDGHSQKIDVQNDNKVAIAGRRQDARLVRRRLLMVEEDTATKDDHDVKSPKVKRESLKDFNGKEPVSALTAHRVPSPKGPKILQHRRVVRRLVRRRVYKRVLRPRYETITFEKVIRNNHNDDSSKSKKQESLKRLAASPSPSPTPTSQNDISVSVRNVVRNFVRLVMRSGNQGEGFTQNSNSTDTGLLSEERSIHGGIIVGPEDIHDPNANTTGSLQTEVQVKREIPPRADSLFEDNITLVDVPIQPRQKVQMRMSLILQDASLTDDMNDALIGCMSSASGTKSTEWGAFDADRFTTELVHVDYYMHLSEKEVESFVRTIDDYVRDGNLTDCMRNQASVIGFGMQSAVFVGKAVYKPQDVELDISEYGTPSWVIGVGIAIAAGAGVVALMVLTSQSQDVNRDEDASEPSIDYSKWAGSPVVLVNARLMKGRELDEDCDDDQEQKEMEKIAGTQHAVTLSSLPQ